MLAIALVLLAFCCGALPFGVWLARLAGIDVRHSGSGNIGATNVARTAGLRLGLLTLLADCAKGFLPVAVVVRILPNQLWLAAAAALAAVLGHVFSPLLHFRGGKGVSTAFGVVLALAPTLAGLSLAVFVGVALLTRYVSLASICAASVLPLLSHSLAYERSVTALTSALAVLVILRHSENLRRLLSGKETRFRTAR